MRAFRPSTHGFKFRNAFTGSPLPISLGKLDRTLGVPDHYGLCGGMSAAAADFFLAERTIPSSADVPGKGTPLYNYIFARQTDSLGPALGEAARFAAWMSLPDEGPGGARSRSILTLPVIARAIDHGEPIMLGLVLTSTRAKGKLWENHQVMAYDFRSVAGGVPPTPPARARRSAGATGGASPVWSIRIYDPNFPSIDDARLDVRLTVEGARPAIAAPGRPGSLIPVLGIDTVRRAGGRRDAGVRGVFVMPYAPKAPGSHLH